VLARLSRGGRRLVEHWASGSRCARAELWRLWGPDRNCAVESLYTQGWLDRDIDRLWPALSTLQPRGPLVILPSRPASPAVRTVVTFALPSSAECRQVVYYRLAAITRVYSTIPRLAGDPRGPLQRLRAICAPGLDRLHRLGRSRCSPAVLLTVRLHVLSPSMTVACLKGPARPHVSPAHRSVVIGRIPLRALEVFGPAALIDASA